MKLPLNGLPGWYRVALGTVGSTNSEAMAWFESGDPGNLWITAQSQTKGKGRRGRDWHSPEGNLYASVLLVDPAPVAATATLPLVVALALFDAITMAVPELAGRLKIKWPNDLLLDGSKVSGILLEGRSQEDGSRAVIIGFGVNCASAPKSGLYPTSSLSQLAGSVSVEKLFDALAVSLSDLLGIWARGEGFTTIRERWLTHAAGIGGTLTASFADYEVTGKFRDLDSDGMLILDLPNGTTQRISAADIFLGNSDRQRA